MPRVLTVTLFVLAGLAFGVVKVFHIGGFGWAAFGTASLLFEPLLASLLARGRAG